MKKTGRIVVSLCCFVLAIAGAWLLGQGSSSRSALQKYKAELKAKGEKLSLEELKCPRVNHIDTYCAITNAVAKIGPQRFEAWSLQPMKYIGPGQALPVWKDDGADFCASNGTWEAFSAQLPALQAVLEKIRQALKQPDADAGPLLTTSNWLSGGPRFNFVALRTAAQWLRGDALADVRQGRLEAGLQDIEALAELARMERDEYVLVAQMIRSAVGGCGLVATWDVLQAPGWTEPQLERLQKAWETVNLADVAEKGLVGERALSAEWWWDQLRQHQGRNTWRHFRTLSRPGSSASVNDKLRAILSDYIAFPLYRMTCIDADESYYLQYMQDVITAARLPNQHRPWPETQCLLTNTFARFEQRCASPQAFRYHFSLVACPNYMRAVTDSAHNETLRRLAVAAIALKRFQLRHGNFPKSLDALVPEFLPAVPEDPMSGKALCYRLDAKLGFVLYSVGEDGKDDGGDPQPPPGAIPGLWGGRDAVWPSSSRPESMTRDR